jgi:hypothetical protein
VLLVRFIETTLSRLSSAQVCECGCLVSSASMRSSLINDNVRLIHTELPRKVSVKRVINFMYVAQTSGLD